MQELIKFKNLQDIQTLIERLKALDSDTAIGTNI